MFDVKEKPKMVERAFLVGVQHSHNQAEEIENLLEELGELVNNLGIKVEGMTIARIRKTKANFLLGTGKTEEIIELAKALNCDCIVFDEELTPGQQRNWESTSNLCVIDRQEVILDIFANRAQTKEAVLQVELARAEYALPRLKRAWTHLSRQRGGGVTQRGEGEAQIELDQRIVRDRIAKLKRELTEVVQHRQVQRKQRLRVPVPTASIVGYTNAGKSSLLNKLTNSEVLEADKLFATLDPTTKRLELPNGQIILLTDTVGFVRKLPHRLVEAFKATLEETLVADFLIHVIDISNHDAQQHAETTLEVLKELGAEEKRVLTVYNKIDLLDPQEAKLNSMPVPAGGTSCSISTKTGQGIDNLLSKMEDMLLDQVSAMNLVIPHHRYDLINQLHQAGAVCQSVVKDDGVHIKANVPRRLFELAIAFKKTAKKHL